jgi:hypothetical protein
MKEGPPTPVVKTTSSVSKQKPAPKPVSTAVEGLEKPSEKPTQAIGTGDGIVAQNNSSRNGLFGFLLLLLLFLLALLAILSLY